MKHSIEELGDFADSNADGQLHIFKTAHDERGRNSPVDEPWGCKVGADYGGNFSETHYGETADAAVTKALDAHDRALNPDNQT